MQRHRGRRLQRPVVLRVVGRRDSFGAAAGAIVSLYRANGVLQLEAGPVDLNWKFEDIFGKAATRRVGTEEQSDGPVVERPHAKHDYFVRPLDEDYTIFVRRGTASRG